MMTMPDDHPIVERPDDLLQWQNPYIPESYAKRLRQYIVQLEHNLERATAAMAEGVKNMQRLEAEVKRLTDAIREKDRRLERLAEEADAWERR